MPFSALQYLELDCLSKQASGNATSGLEGQNLTMNLPKAEFRAKNFGQLISKGVKK